MMQCLLSAIMVSDSTGRALTEGGKRLSNDHVVEPAIQAAMDEADLLQKQEAARKAQFDAEAAARTAAQASSPLGVELLEAETRQKIAQADQAAREAAVVIDPELARQQKEAEARKVVAESEQAAADARQKQVASLIPNFGAITAPEAKVEGDGALAGSILAHHALRSAAQKVANALGHTKSDGTPNDANDGALKAGKESAGQKTALLVTTKEDLASADAAYLEVNRGLAQLRDEAQRLLDPPAEDARGFMPAPLLGAMAGALPGLVSLLLPRQSVRNASVEVDTTAAVASLLGQLVPARIVLLDDFRLVESTALSALEAELRRKRGDLVGKKQEVASDKARFEAEVELLSKELGELEKANPPVPDDLAAKRSERDDKAVAAARAAGRFGAMEDLMKVIDGFLAAVHTAGDGGRSPFVAAALHEQIRSGSPKITQILFVKASSAEIDQLYEDRKFKKDRFTSLGSISITYWLMDTATSAIVASGVELGTVRVEGEVGGAVTPQVI